MSSRRQPGFFAGDARIAVLPAASGAELGVFLKATFAANSHLLTDGFAGYRGRQADLGEYLKHTPVIQDDSANAGQFFPIIPHSVQQHQTRLEDLKCARRSW